MDKELLKKLQNAYTLKEIFDTFLDFYDIGNISPGQMTRVIIIKGLYDAVKMFNFKKA